MPLAILVSLVFFGEEANLLPGAGRGRGAGGFGDEREGESYPHLTSSELLHNSREALVDFWKISENCF